MRITFACEMNDDHDPGSDVGTIRGRDYFGGRLGSVRYFAREMNHDDPGPWPVDSPDETSHDGARYSSGSAPRIDACGGDGSSLLADTPGRRFRRGRSGGRGRLRLSRGFAWLTYPGPFPTIRLPRGL